MVEFLQYVGNIPRVERPLFGDGGVANTKITIGTNPLGSETLDGAAPSSTGNPLDPGTPYFAATFYTDGSNWFIY